MVEDEMRLNVVGTRYFALNCGDTRALGLGGPPFWNGERCSRTFFKCILQLSTLFSYNSTWKDFHSDVPMRRPTRLTLSHGKHEKNLENDRDEF